MHRGPIRPGNYRKSSGCSGVHGICDYRFVEQQIEPFFSCFYVQVIRWFLRWWFCPKYLEKNNLLHIGVLFGRLVKNVDSGKLL